MLCGSGWASLSQDATLLCTGPTYCSIYPVLSRSLHTMAADSTGTGDVPEKKKPHAGIPEAVFVDDVDAFMKLAENNENADIVLQRLDEQHTKYKFMEHNLLQKRRRLKSQIPDIRSSLDIVNYMKAKLESPNPLETQFLLSDQVFVKAKIPPTDKVCLWLGANVMLEYSLDDAEALLSKNLETATKNLVQLDDDLDFLRDQFTTAEVNMARVYNWNVKRRQAAKMNS